MKQALLFSVYGFAGIAALTIALVPVAGAVRETDRLIMQSQPVNASATPVVRIRNGEIPCPSCVLSDVPKRDSHLTACADSDPTLPPAMHDTPCS